MHAGATRKRRCTSCGRTDLVDLFEACIDRRLAEMDVSWKSEAGDGFGRLSGQLSERRVDRGIETLTLEGVVFPPARNWPMARLSLVVAACWVSLRWARTSPRRGIRPMPLWIK